ncbi:MAG: HupE/UreJ family protein [Myxococcota bacterium]|nr:HupE/UreJ family protein [Myxococcota bacterium]
MRIAAAALGAALLAATPAPAHGPTTSYSTSEWRVESVGPSIVHVRARVQRDDAARALGPGFEQHLDRHLVEHLRLAAAGAPCTLEAPVHALPATQADHLVRAWQLRCDDAALTLEADPFADALPDHVHLARFEGSEGRGAEHVFAAGATPWLLPGAGRAPAGTFPRYLRLGVEHILEGTDHLAFVLALLAVGARLREVALLVTGFTLAHSLTLAAGALGWAEPRAQAIEALIGLSIAVVALENFALTGGPALRRGVSLGLAALIAGAALASGTGRFGVPVLALAGVGLFSLSYFALAAQSKAPTRIRWYAAFAFGLIHGFGFAGLLTELGLPPDRLAVSLLGFNLGVELGQLAVVAVAWPLLRRWLHAPAPRAARVQWLSTPILAVGLYWFLARGLG